MKNAICVHCCVDNVEFEASLFGYLTNFVPMDFELDKRYRDAIRPLKDDIGEEPDLQSVLFLIGVQELGMGFRTFKKDEKLNLMHIAICTVLEPFGYYEFTGRDADDWPHYENLKDLPSLNNRDQEMFMKEAVVTYFENH